MTKKLIKAPEHLLICSRSLPHYLTNKGTGLASAAVLPGEAHAGRFGMSKLYNARARRRVLAGRRDKTNYLQYINEWRNENTCNK